MIVKSGHFFFDSDSIIGVRFFFEDVPKDYFRRNNDWREYKACFTLTLREYKSDVWVAIPSMTEIAKHSEICAQALTAFNVSFESYMKEPDFVPTVIEEKPKPKLTFWEKLIRRKIE